MADIITLADIMIQKGIEPDLASEIAQEIIEDAEFVFGKNKPGGQEIKEIPMEIEKAKETTIEDLRGEIRYWQYEQDYYKNQGKGLMSAKGCIEAAEKHINVLSEALSLVSAEPPKCKTFTSRLGTERARPMQGGGSAVLFQAMGRQKQKESRLPSGRPRV